MDRSQRRPIGIGLGGIIKTNQEQVVRDGESAAAGGVDGAQGHSVVTGKDRIQVRALVQEYFQAFLTAFGQPIACHYQRRAGIHAGWEPDAEMKAVRDIRPG